MKLRNKKSVMTTLPEGQAPVSVKPKITQLIYFAILLALVAYIFYIFGQRYFYFSEPAYVEVEKTVISASRGGKVKSVSVTDGQLLKRDDAIAVVGASRICQQESSRDLEKVRHEIEIIRAKLATLRNDLVANKKSLDAFVLKRALELNRGLYQDSQRLQRERQKLLSDIGLLVRELAIQREREKQLQVRPASVNLPLECFNEVIKAPYKAQVYAVKKQANEFANRGEPVVVLIRDKAPVRIELYLDTEFYDSIKIGDRLVVRFPDGSKGEGRVKVIHSSAYQEPSREWRKYQPAEPRIRVHLEPRDEQAYVKWRQFDRMEVMVRGMK